jgi:alanyl aminopeptidase
MRFRPPVYIATAWLCIAASAIAQQSPVQPVGSLSLPSDLQAPEFRLGDAATPLGYAVHLSIDPALTEFEGEIAIELRIDKPQAVLWLNGTDLAILSANIQMTDRNIELSVVPGGNDFIGFTASGGLPAGNAKLHIHYRGKLDPLSTRGLFRQQEGADWYVISQFEALSARRAYPCFDEPGWKTPWQITLDVPAGMVAVSNTPVLEEAASPGGRKLVRFARTRPLPSYLVALAVGPFDVVDGGTAGAKHTLLRYFAPRGRGPEMRYAKEITPRLLELLEDYFGMPYPFEKLDSVSIPQTVNFGAMENAGMITYASRILMAKTHDETDSFKRRYASISAHEISHQWFGDLVTLKWWDDTWLNESFATWLASKTLYRFEPLWDDGWYRAYARGRAIALDRLVSTRRVHNPVDTRGDVRSAFDSISYDKGGQVLAMFEAALTPERFRSGVRRYLERHAYGSATAKDFVVALAESADENKDLIAAFQAFVDQPGLPLIDVALDCQDAARPALALSQSRFKPLGSKMGSIEQWLTPVCFRFGWQGKTFTTCGTVTGSASRLPLSEANTCPDWVLANADGNGYYVAHYTDELREKLGRQARKLPAPEAAALVSDAILMTESGLMTVGAALSLADQYAQHPSPVVRRTVVDLLRRLSDGWLTNYQHKRFVQIMKRHIVPQAHRLGWLGKSGEDNRIRDLRGVLLPFAADRGASSLLQKEAVILANRWLVKRDAIPAAIVEAVLDTAAATADRRVFANLETEALTTQDRRDRSWLLAALGKVRDPALRERALALSLNESLGGRDALDLASTALEDDTNRAAAFIYMREHYDMLTAKFPPDTAGNLITALGRLCQTQDRNTFVEFFSARSKNIIGGAHRYTQALERIDLCIAARGANFHGSQEKAQAKIVISSRPTSAQ